jgi:uncharacterized protein DUF3617
MKRLTILYLGGTSACLLFGSLAGAVAQATGDLWQVTPQMTMQGLALPLSPQQVCSAKQWTRAPAAGPDPTCVNNGFAMSGNTASWMVTCKSPPSTGVGQITRSGDSYTGSIKFTTADGEMTINLTGNRIGDCNNPN